MKIEKTSHTTVLKCFVEHFHLTHLTVVIHGTIVHSSRNGAEAKSQNEIGTGAWNGGRGWDLKQVEMAES
jgi:hypothetical protein